MVWRPSSEGKKKRRSRQLCVAMRVCFQIEQTRSYSRYGQPGWLSDGKCFGIDGTLKKVNSRQLRRILVSNSIPNGRKGALCDTHQRNGSPQVSSASSSAQAEHSFTVAKSKVVFIGPILEKCTHVMPDWFPSFCPTTSPNTGPISSSAPRDSLSGNGTNALKLFSIKSSAPNHRDTPSFCKFQFI